MNDIYLSFPEKLLEGNHDAGEHQDNNAHNSATLLAINAELLRICEQQKRLLDEQSAMIVEMLESMGR